MTNLYPNCSGTLEQKVILFGFFHQHRGTKYSVVSLNYSNIIRIEYRIIRTPPVEKFIGEIVQFAIINTGGEHCTVEKSTVVVKKYN